MTAMAAKPIEPGDDRRFYAYVIKHNSTPIWVGMGSGSRHEIKGHCTSSVKPDAKREYILNHLSEITSEIVFADLPWEEAAEKESALIEEFGLRCDGTGPLFNRTYGAHYGDQVAWGALDETKAKRRAAYEERLRIAKRIAKVRSVTVRTALQNMNQYRKGGGDAGYRFLLGPNHPPKRRRRRPATSKADEKAGPNV
jgi:hypothetical protein